MTYKEAMAAKLFRDVGHPRKGRKMRMRVTIEENASGQWHNILVNGRTVGRGTEAECQPLAEELRADPVKAAAVYAMFEK